MTSRQTKRAEELVKKAEEKGLVVLMYWEEDGEWFFQFDCDNFSDIISGSLEAIESAINEEYEINIGGK